jgi:hypothetical protein
VANCFATWRQRKGLKNLTKENLGFKKNKSPYLEEKKARSHHV